MDTFLNDSFLLHSDIAEDLFHNYAKQQPIIDYHNHLPPAEVAQDKRFENLTQAWLYGDHYKWRAMRANGIDEEYITGEASDREKFLKWAETVPYTVRNPLYHWTHLELRRYFGIAELLTPKSAEHIYERASEQLREASHSTNGLLERMHVEVICTTDDPIDSLEHHQQFAQKEHAFRMFPAFRPDKAMNTDNIPAFNRYVDRLAEACNTDIGDFRQYLDALKARHDFFGEQNCRVSDHGLPHLYADDYTEREVAGIFGKIRSGREVSAVEHGKFKSAMLVHFAEWDHEKGWVQQYHVGAFRNTNSRKFASLGPDTGWDSIGDYRQGETLVRFLDRLDRNDKLAKTIIYNLNASDNDLFASMTGNFNDGSVAGKIQFGSGWWYHDQLDGMAKQINALSNIGLISRFVGMLTDSRSFLSFPRHEYFRRLLCNIFAEDMKKGMIPNDVPWIGNIISDICYRNAKRYFGF